MVRKQGEDTDLGDDGPTLVPGGTRKGGGSGSTTTPDVTASDVSSSIQLAAAAPSWASVEANCNGRVIRARFQGRPRKADLRLPDGQSCTLTFLGGAPATTRLTGGQHVSCAYRGKVVCD